MLYIQSFRIIPCLQEILPSVYINRRECEQLDDNLLHLLSSFSVMLRSGIIIPFVNAEALNDNVSRRHSLAALATASSDKKFLAVISLKFLAIAILSALSNVNEKVFNSSVLDYTEKFKLISNFIRYLH